MAHVQDLMFSRRDAEALARLLANHRRVNPFEADGSDALADLMLEARFVSEEAFPADRIGLHSTVTYAPDGDSVHRTVTLVEPAAADAAAGRISVLSPIGLALIGRRRGAVSDALLPNGRRLTLRVLDAAPALEAAA